jgi:flagellar hook-associated protein 2
MSNFSFSGLSSGLDTKSIISQLMSIDSKPKLQLQWNQQLVASRKAAWTDLNSKLLTLKTASNALLQADTWDQSLVPAGTNTFSASSGDPSRLAATVTGTPTAGSYNVQVTQLAQGEISRSTATGGTVAADDTLTIGQGASTWNIALTTGDTLADIVQKINGTAGIGVAASIDTNGAIKLASTASGASSAFTVSSAGASAATLGFAELQSAQNAFYSVDGVFQQSASNFNATGAITGVSLNLTGITSTTLTVQQTNANGKTVAQQWEDATVQKVKDFASAYNSILDTVQQKTQGESKVTTPADKKTGLTLSEYLTGPMARNTAFSSVATQLRGQVGDSVAGLAPGASMLADVGITSSYAAGSASGKLTVDETKLRAALKADPNSVQSLLGNVGTASTGVAADAGIARRVNEMVSSMQASDGVVGNAIMGAGSEDKRLQSSIDNATARLEKRQSYYERMYASLEVSLGKLQTQSSWLQGQLAGLSSNR